MVQSVLQAQKIEIKYYIINKKKPMHAPVDITTWNVLYAMTIQIHILTIIAQLDN